MPVALWANPVTIPRQYSAGHVLGLHLLEMVELGAGHVRKLADNIVCGLVVPTEQPHQRDPKGFTL
jgi:hypothetical protein